MFVVHSLNKKNNNRKTIELCIFSIHENACYDCYAKINLFHSMHILFFFLISLHTLKNSLVRSVSIFSDAIMYAAGRNIRKIIKKNTTIHFGMHFARIVLNPIKIQ